MVDEKEKQFACLQIAAILLFLSLLVCFAKRVDQFTETPDLVPLSATVRVCKETTMLMPSGGTAQADSRQQPHASLIVRSCPHRHFNDVGSKNEDGAAEKHDLWISRSTNSQELPVDVGNFLQHYVWPALPAQQATCGTFVCEGQVFAVLRWDSSVQVFTPTTRGDASHDNRFLLAVPDMKLRQKVQDANLASAFAFATVGRWENGGRNDLWRGRYAAPAAAAARLASKHGCLLQIIFFGPGCALSEDGNCVHSAGADGDAVRRFLTRYSRSRSIPAQLRDIPVAAVWINR
jgi:hypothetical protein